MDALATRGAATLSKPDSAPSKVIIVHACGRTINLPEQASTLQDVQSALQYSLSVRQNFELYDRDGRRIATDAELCHAISNSGGSLTATLPDVSIHSIEDRREELAQMQWKLVRDQQHSASMGITSITRQVAAIEAALESERKDRASAFERMKKDFSIAIEASEAKVLGEVRHVEEQVASVASIAKSERNMREVAFERQGGEIQLLREAIDGHREQTRQAINHAMEKVESNGQSASRERALREALEERLRQERENLIARMETMTANMKSMVQEVQSQFNKVAQDVHEKMEDHSRNNMKFKTILETSHEDANARVDYMDDRCKNLESRLGELVQRHAESMELVGKRNEQVSQAVEVLRMEVAKQHSTFQGIVEERVQDFEPMVNAVKTELSQRIVTDRAQRQQQHRALKEAIMTEYGAHLSQLENRMHSRFERESTAREHSMKDLVSHIHSSSKADLSGVPAMMDATMLSVGESEFSKPATNLDVSRDRFNSDMTSRIADATRNIDTTPMGQTQRVGAADTGGGAALRRSPADLRRSPSDAFNGMSTTPTAGGRQSLPRGGSMQIPSVRSVNSLHQAQAPAAMVAPQGGSLNGAMTYTPMNSSRSLSPNLVGLVGGYMQPATMTPRVARA
mmetsp:Transcript_65901/g.183600  ORF Transcript_65901/g.183600 Transcript_65901/m.183600 type:complete len:629 (-) Transcript_65901:106-1992(-)